MYGLVLELDSSAHTVLLEVTVYHVLLGPESTDHCTLTTCCRGASHKLHSHLVLARCPWLVLGDLYAHTAYPARTAKHIAQSGNTVTRRC